MCIASTKSAKPNRPMTIDGTRGQRVGREPDRAHEPALHRVLGEVDGREHGDRASR